jgi:teichuronic acid biosynthesis glycosyltransferase TuaH
MAKILYITGNNWGWIKQRPQFLAEELAKANSLFVLYKASYKSLGLSLNKSNLPRLPILRLPFSRFILIKTLNRALEILIIHISVYLHQPDIIFFSDPEQFTNPRFFRGKIVLDYMDDHRAWTRVKTEAKRLQRIEKLEKEAFVTCAKIFVSSVSLRTKLIHRGCPKNKVCLVFNAFGGLAMKDRAPQKRNEGDLIQVLYFGAISDYFDIDSVIKLLESDERIYIHLAGPVEKLLPSHPRLIILGTIEHSDLMRKAREYEYYIYPFLVNDLIASVDPVKIYEYINLGGQIISVEYEEIRKFKDFIYFYNDKKKIDVVFQDMLRDKKIKYSIKERNEFLAQNSWQHRAELINRELQIL